jgi:hypothetical protein
MSLRVRSLIAAVAVLGLVAGTAQAGSTTQTNEASAPPVMWDVFLIRPASVVLTGVSAGLVFPIAALLTGITRPSEIGKPYQILVQRPVDFTFRRPLGDW